MAAVGSTNGTANALPDPLAHAAPATPPAAERAVVANPARPELPPGSTVASLPAAGAMSGAFAIPQRRTAGVTVGAAASPVPERAAEPELHHAAADPSSEAFISENPAAAAGILQLERETGRQVAPQEVTEVLFILGAYCSEVPTCTPKEKAAGKEMTATAEARMRETGEVTVDGEVFNVVDDGMFGPFQNAMWESQARAVLNKEEEVPGHLVAKAVVEAESSLGAIARSRSGSITVSVAKTLSENPDPSRAILEMVQPNNPRSRPVWGGSGSGGESILATAAAPMPPAVAAGEGLPDDVRTLLALNDRARVGALQTRFSTAEEIHFIAQALDRQAFDVAQDDRRDGNRAAAGLSPLAFNRTSALV